MSSISQNRLTLSQLLDTLGDLTGLESETELQLIELKEGDILFEQGQEADSVYVLIAGVLGVRVKHPDSTETVIDKLAPGAIVGEMALMSGQKRSATVFAINDAGVICLTRSHFEKLTEEDRAVLETLDATFAPRWQRIHLVNILKNLFGELDTSSLHAIQREMEWQHYSNGDIIFKQGDEPDGMYIVVNGRLRVIVYTPAGDERLIGEIGPGETVGEYAVLTDDLRSATVYAVRETNLAKITSSVFCKLIRDYPELMIKIAGVIVERQQRNLKGIISPSCPARTITILPTSASLDIQPFVNEIADALSSFGNTFTLTSQTFDDKFGKPGISYSSPEDASNPAIVAWMDELEANNNFVLYVADADPSLWTKRCISQADRVLIIADPRGDPSPSVTEQILTELEVPVRTELVLLHPSDTQQPEGTATWLDNRRVDAHHHIRLGTKAHVERLARRISGHAYSLVFSGGGARGFSQLGVYQAMTELDIPIDYVGGTSFGALLAGSIAQCLPYNELIKLANFFANSKQIFDYTLPFTSLMTSRKVTLVCQKVYGDLQIEDLWIPFFCVSSNLSCAEPVIHQRGPLWRAVRASLSIPGVFAPVIENGEVLVDGGLMDNFPVELMVRLSESDRVIGVQANPHIVQTHQYDYDTSISGWKILFRKLNPFAKPVRSPSLIGTILRAQQVNSTYQTKLSEPITNLLIQMDLRKFGFLDFDDYKEIVKSGYEIAFEPLRYWKKNQGIN